MRPRASRALGLAPRLFAAQALIVVTGTATLFLVARLVGPLVFRSHLDEAGLAEASATRHHVQEAFQSTSAITFGLAVLPELAVALAISLFVSRRIGRSVSTVARAAHELADGNYAIRVPAPGLGEEFDQLATDFNRMASRLHHVEQTRRRLLADLAHEMRTPLATLDAHLEGIEDGVRTLDPATLALMRTQTVRLTRLAEDIADVSRAEEGQITLNLRPVPLGALLESAAAAVRERYTGKGVTLDVVQGPAALTVRADPDRLNQVLGNLLDNALRHTRPQGAVTLTVQAVPAGVTIEVRDTGEGIAPEHLEHVFERFYRADAARDRQHGGSGIGLAISQALVQAHRGTIRVSSAGPGTGATFTVTLPSA